jgi:hypothetical protein
VSKRIAAVFTICKLSPFRTDVSSIGQDVNAHDSLDREPVRGLNDAEIRPMVWVE